MTDTCFWMLGSNSVLITDCLLEVALADVAIVDDSHDVLEDEVVLMFGEDISEPELWNNK